MRCVNCGKELDENEKFCTKCGTSIDIENDKTNIFTIKKNNALNYKYAIIIVILIPLLIFIFLILRFVHLL